MRELHPLHFLALEVFSDLDTTIFCDFFKRRPNFAALKRAKSEVLECFLKSHRSGRPAVIKRRIELIKTAVSLTEDNAVIKPHQRYVLGLINLLGPLLQTIKAYDHEIGTLFEQHEDRDIFASFPGAGENMAPRLLAAFGSDRSAFNDADEINRYAGIAPVIERSGKKTWVHWRFKCSRFLRQTFIEWANQTVKYSFWARAFYDEKRARGKSHQATIRALAFKWVRIMYRCWKNQKTYDEATYLFALEKRKNKIACSN